ncbi:Betaine aldehyde dehydrogenase [Raoultella planticola]|uniref:Betaine aldehyde dehydrogenase n=1 Tax=Raoultella planticola TaxID=575 RepID=A0A485DBQ0_RAOPL|nr:Betaine aldehyde dehydrogenase [Raoultella planticola]
MINVVNGAGGEIAQRLIAHPACAKVSFTGSVATGEKVQQAATGAGKRVTLELGGQKRRAVSRRSHPRDDDGRHY